MSSSPSNNPRARTPDVLIQSEEQLQACINRISFINTIFGAWEWTFHYRAVHIDAAYDDPPDAWLVWAEFTRPETHTGVMGRGRGRDEIVRVGTTESGVIKTCWVLVKLLVDHELMEGFQVDGLRVFDPHNTIADLQLAQTQGTRADDRRWRALQSHRTM